MNNSEKDLFEFTIRTFILSAKYMPVPMYMYKGLDAWVYRIRE